MGHSVICPYPGDMLTDDDLSPVERVAIATQESVRRSKERAAAKRKKRRPAFPALPNKGKPSEVIRNEVQKFLAEKNPKSRDGERRLETIFESLHRRATDLRSRQAVSCAALLFAYAFGKPRRSRTAFELRKEAGLRVVYINHS